MISFCEIFFYLFSDKDGDKEDGEKGEDDDSSDDDDLTVTIGTIKTQPDIIQAAPHGARFQPKVTSRLLFC